MSKRTTRDKLACGRRVVSSVTGGRQAWEWRGMQIAPGPLARRTQALRTSQNDSRLEKTSGSTWGGALAALRVEGHSQQPVYCNTSKRRII